MTITIYGWSTSALLETRHRRTVEYSKGVGGVMLAMFHGAGPGL